MHSMQLSLANITIRQIKKSDNKTLASIIRYCLTEFGADKPGTVFYDESTDNLYDLFQKEKSVYWVALFDKKIIGGGGIFPTEGLPVDTCELVKMYLLPEVRNIGLGKKLMEYCFDFARRNDFTKVYIETLPELYKAVAAYEKCGFTYLQNPIGSSGHFGCDVWMIKDL